MMTKCIKMYNTVLPSKILLQENTKGLKAFLGISCIYSLMSQQDKKNGQVTKEINEV